MRKHNKLFITVPYKKIARAHKPIYLFNIRITTLVHHFSHIQNPKSLEKGVQTQKQIQMQKSEFRRRKVSSNTEKEVSSDEEK